MVRRLAVGAGDVFETLLATNSRPMELVTIYISLGSALMLAFHPDILNDNANFSLLQAIDDGSHVVIAAIFAALGLTHLITMFYSRAVRRLVMGARLIWSFVLMYSVVTHEPFGPADLLYSLYFLCASVAFIQIRTGEPSPPHRAGRMAV